MTEVTSEPKVYMRHIRAANICASGARGFWKHHGLDWSDFLANGIAADTLAATGEPAALRVIEIMRAEYNGR